MRFDFTPREQAILDLLLVGFAPVEIAQELGMARRTLKAHFARIYGKLEIPTTGRFRPFMRLVYILSYKEGLLTGWPDPL